ncbi:MAG: hypothetical protein J5565_02940 [Muribaculaceae bacterium]|nr:hypothetical protein [Muribaculaceae bacterium]
MTKALLSNDPGSPPLTWLNADTGYLTRDENGNPLTNSIGRGAVSVSGTQGGGMKNNKLSLRPGKHLAEYPNASQFAGNDGMIPENVVFFEVEYAADGDLHKDYQRQAWEYGTNEKGDYNNTLGGLPYIPKDSYYIYRTNQIADGATPMIITGAYRITRALTDAEARQLNEAEGGKWVPRRGGELTEEGLREMGLDEAGLEKMRDEFDYSTIEESHDESEDARRLPGYVRNPINFDNDNLRHAAQENGQNLEDYSNGYDGPTKVDRKNISEEKKALQGKMMGWLTEENIDWAEGKEQDEIFKKFGNEPEPIAIMPDIVRKNIPSIENDYLYCGKGYLIDHQANHHPELGSDEYINIQTILDSYDDIKDLSIDDNIKMAFVKKLDKGYAVVAELSKENNKIVLHKTFFYQHRNGKHIPYKNKPSIIKKWSEDGSTSISPAENQQPAETENLSTLDHLSDGKVSAENRNVQENGEKSGKYSVRRNKEFEEAVESGNTETAERMVKEAAKRAMPETKVVDKDGEPLVMHHNTDSGEFYIFDRNRIGSGQGQAFLGMGFNFSRWSNSTYGRNDMQVFLDARHPLESEGHTLRRHEIEEVFRKLDEGESDTLLAELAGDYIPYGTPGYEKALQRVAKDLVANYDDLGIYGTISVVAGASKADAIIDAFKSLGYDSSIERDGDGRIRNAVVFDSSQIKSADAVTYDDNGNLIPLSERFNPEKEDIRYSVSRRVNAGGVQEVKDVELPRITDENRNNKDVRVQAMRAIGGNLNKLRQAMSKQREYDRGTVEQVTGFAKELIDNGLLDGMTDHEVKQMLTKIKNATGKEDITNDVNKLVDLMVNHQLRRGKQTFEELLNTKACD